MPARKRNSYWKFPLVLAAAALCFALLSGCGGPKNDLDIFIMSEHGLAENLTKNVKTALQEKLGEDKKIAVTGSMIYNDQKLLVEIAAGDHDIFILPKKDFLSITDQGGAIPLDDTFDRNAYPDGVAEGTVTAEDDTETRETHLYGIPLTASPLFKEAGYVSLTEEADMYMLVFIRSHDPAYAKSAMKEMLEP